MIEIAVFHFLLFLVPYKIEWLWVEMHYIILEIRTKAPNGALFDSDGRNPSKMWMIYYAISDDVKKKSKLGVHLK